MTVHIKFSWSLRINFRIFHCFRETNQKLAAISSLVCLTPERLEDIPNFSDYPSQRNDCYDDGDIIVISSEDKQKRCPAKPKPRERGRKISLKFCWKMDVHKIAVLSVRRFHTDNNVLCNIIVAKGIRSTFDVTFLSNTI